MGGPRPSYFNPGYNENSSLKTNNAVPLDHVQLIWKNPSCHYTM